jgi:hypothetical protein
MSARLEIHRLKGYLDPERAYTVLVDGEAVAELHDDARAAVSLAPGAHTLEIRCKPYGSRTVKFWAHPGATVTARCGSWLRGLGVLLVPFVMLLTPRRHIALQLTVPAKTKRSSSISA